MNNQTTTVEKVSDVIQVMQAGINFYKDAVEELDSPMLQTTFRKIISHKQSAIETLQPLAVAEQGERETGTDFGVDSRKLYTKLAGMLSNQKKFTYVNQLEEVEDKVLEVLDDALSEEQPAIAELALRNVRTDAQSIHDEMKSLQHTLEH